MSALQSVAVALSSLSFVTDGRRPSSKLCRLGDAALGLIDLSEAMERLGNIRMIRAEDPFSDSEYIQRRFGLVVRP
jgi:hypothetical protein